MNSTLKVNGLRPANLPNELWLDVPGTDGMYQISSMGRLMTMNYKWTGQQRLMKPATDAGGYLRTMIRKDGRVRTVKLHRIVAEAFHANPDGLAEVNHKNFEKQDNRAVNLEWMSRQHNMGHAAAGGKIKDKHGSFNGMSKLTEQTVREIKAKYIPYVYTHEMLGKEYGVAKSTIKDALNRHWRHVI